MPENIYIKCGLENCTQYFEYTLDTSDPIALTAQWRNEESKGGIWGGLLATKPVEGEKYELQIWGALKIDLSENFWVSYFDPYSTHEGLESEEGINSARFCICKKLDIIEIGINNISLTVEVLQARDLGYAERLPKTSCQITQILDKEVNSSHYSIEDFDRFSLIKLNYQSDIGWTFIVSKYGHTSRIVATNFWDFHQNIWQFTNEELTPEQENKYGIQHRTQ